MLKPEFRHVDSRIPEIKHVDSRSYVAKEDEAAPKIDLAALHQIATQVVRQEIAANQEQLRGPQGDAWAHEDVANIVQHHVKEHVANAEHLRGPAGKDGASLEEIRALVVQEVANVIAANPEQFRGLPGRDGESVVGPQGEPGLRGESVTGPQGPSGPAVSAETVASVVQEVLKSGDFKGEKGEKGDTGVGRDGKDAVSLEQILSAVENRVNEVLAANVPKNLILALHKRLNEIDAEANTRPSWRPIYSSITNSLRQIINSANYSQ